MQKNMPKWGTMLMAAVIAVWVGLLVTPAFAQDEDADGVPDAIDRCPETVIPEATAPTQGLKVDHFALTNDDMTFDTVAPAQATFTTTDTFGCSCEQIIAQLELGQGHEKFGCSLTAMQAWIGGLFPAPVGRTGQTVLVLPGDDGEIQAGVAFPTPRFTDSGNGTVLDNLTGLIWLKDANCSAISLAVWATALSNANSLANGQCGLADGSAAGDWRLPNVKELESLIDFGTAGPALHPGHPFSGVRSNNYWSSTTRAGDSGRAWNVYLDDGNTYPAGKGGPFLVWPVRGGQ